MKSLYKRTLAIIDGCKSKFVTRLSLLGYALSILLFTTNAQALSAQEYLQRFLTYIQWSQNLPEKPDEQFLSFIAEDTPLANKLRAKWLYKLAQQKDWPDFSKYYKPSTDVTLQCFALSAQYYQGQEKEAFTAAIPLWLSGDSQPQACNQLFEIMLKSEGFDQNLITQRIQQALDKRNLQLARYLLKQYKQFNSKDEQLLLSIYQSPGRIVQLDGNGLHSDFYLYGLKRLVSINMDQALKLWKNPKSKKILSIEQQQAFLSHVALYKAMRNHPDADEWFAQVKPQYYNDILLDWEIRAALKKQNWSQVHDLIEHSANKDSPCWQYWLARAKESLGQKTDAKTIYQQLAVVRNYYGFLASLRLNKSFSFQNENPVSNMAILKPYQVIIENIKSLYNSKQDGQASRLLNDFVSELPKDDQSALVYWVANELQWHGKSVYLSNNEILNNQLALRFPLPHKESVSAYSKNYQIPPEFIYAIIRQESGFRYDVVSAVGARGLMQIMPATATMVAKREKIIYSDKGELFSTQKNINLGVAYLQQLAKRYAQHPVLMAAAYNAGPRQVNYWLKNHPPKEIDIWIETLPWHETRNYLKNVIAFYAVYQYRLKHKPNLQPFLKTL